MISVEHLHCFVHKYVMVVYVIILVEPCTQSKLLGYAAARMMVVGYVQW